MADVLTPEQRKRCMTSVRSRDTKPELIVRRALHAAGFRFRLHRKDLPGKPDIVLPKYRIAVFVNGCFWHGHACHYARLPKTNREFWEKKIDENIHRDLRNLEDLRKLGWHCEIIWTCDLETGCDALLERLSKQDIPIH